VQQFIRAVRLGQQHSSLILPTDKDEASSA